MLVQVGNAAAPIEIFRSPKQHGAGTAVSSQRLRPTPKEFDPGDRIGQLSGWVGVFIFVDQLVDLCIENETIEDRRNIVITDSVFGFLG